MEASVWAVAAVSGSMWWSGGGATASEMISEDSALRSLVSSETIEILCSSSFYIIVSCSKISVLKCFALEYCDFFEGIHGIVYETGISKVE